MKGSRMIKTSIICISGAGAFLVILLLAATAVGLPKATAVDKRGTSEQPLVIQTLPSAPSAEDAKRDTAHDRERSEDLADRASTKQEHLFEQIIAAVVGLATVAILTIQSIAFFRQSRQLELSVEQMQASNRFAREALNADQRPWVKLKVTIDDSMVGQLVFRWSLTNIGKTPAERAHVRIEIVPFAEEFHRPQIHPPVVSARTDVSAELRRFADECAQLDSDIDDKGALLFPNDAPHSATWGDGGLEHKEGVTSPAFSGYFVVLAVAMYRSTIDQSPHLTAQAYSLALEPTPQNQSVNFELVDGRFDLSGRTPRFSLWQEASNYVT
jgi:hypothetical protein